DAPSVKVNLLDDGVVFTFVLVELAGCHPPGNRHYGTMDVRIGVAHAPRGYRERMATEIDLGRLLDVLPAMVWTARPGTSTVGRCWCEIHWAWSGRSPQLGTASGDSPPTTCLTHGVLLPCPVLVCTKPFLNWRQMQCTLSLAVKRTA